MLAASSLGSCLVIVSSAVVTVALAAIGRDMRLSALDLQWVMNAEPLPLAALTLVAGTLGDRVRTEANLPRGDRSLWPGRGSDWFRAEFRAAHRRPTTFARNSSVISVSTLMTRETS